MIDKYGEAEPPLPLQRLDGILQADALLVPWPETDCVAGGITTSLTTGGDGWKPEALAVNRGKCFEGPSPKAKDSC